MGHAFRTRHIKENHGTDIAPLLSYFGRLDAAWYNYWFRDSARCRKMAGARRPANRPRQLRYLAETSLLVR
jgi:hypothetical protein